MNLPIISKSDLIKLLSVIAVGIAFLWLLMCRISIDEDEQAEHENKQDTFEDNEKKKP